MAQHDYDISNQTFPSFRSDLNSVLEAINTSNSGTSRPSSAVAGTIWLDTTNATNPTLKLYDGADDISLATFDYSANTVNWIDSTVVFDIVNDTTPELGGDLSVNGNSIVSTSNGNITFTPDGTGKVVISGLSFPTSDGTDGQAIVTDGCGNLSFASIEGRTGTVNWDTTAKTASFTAVSGNGYFVNTTSTAITVTLPAGSAGDIVGISDYASTFQTNNLTITPNGTDKINGINDDAILDTQGIAVSLVYVDATRGWKSVTGSDNDTTGQLPAFVTATGGTVTCCGDYKIHTFTSPGTFTVTCGGNGGGSNSVEYIVVAGGGGGGSAGGGGGGFRFASPSLAPLTYPGKPLASPANLPVTATGYPITIGGGGSGGSFASCSCRGSNSVFSTITSTGGGGGLSWGVPVCSPSLPGGSGGGGGARQACSPGGSGNTPPVDPPQGNNGGTTIGTPVSFGGSGGGGALAVGTDSPGSTSGADGGIGAGLPSAFGTSGENCGSYYYFSGGGAGGGRSPGTCAGSGGLGGGGDGTAPGTPAPSGTTNTGGGGGGGGYTQPSNTYGNGGNGGSGIVIIRYKYQ